MNRLIRKLCHTCTGRLGPLARWRTRAGVLLGVLAGLFAGGAIVPQAGLAKVFGAPVGALRANTSETCANFSYPVYTAGGIVLEVPSRCTFIGISGGSGASAWTNEVPTGRYVIRQAEVRTGARVGPMAITVIEEAFGPFGFYEETKERSRTFTPRRANAVNRVTGLNLPVFSGFEQGGKVSVSQYVSITVMNDKTPLPVNIGGEAASCQVVAPAKPVGGSVLPGACSVNGNWTPLLSAVLNTFTIQRRVKLLHGGTRARLGLHLEDPGRIRITSGARTAAAARHRSHKRRRRSRVLVRFTHTYHKAGSVHPVIRLTRAGRTRIHGRHRLRIRVKVTLTRTRGTFATKRSAQKLITFRTHRHKH